MWRQPFVTAALAPAISLGAVTLLGTNGIIGQKGRSLSGAERNMPELRSSDDALDRFDQ
mgnify:CR=1 FL=1